MSSSSDNTTLRPIEFEPTSSKPQFRWRGPSWLNGVIFVALLVTGVVLWFLFTAKAIRFDSNVPTASVVVEGVLVFDTGTSWLMRNGSYKAVATAPGYFDLEFPFTVADESEHDITLTLIPLPGILAFTSNPPGATVRYLNEVLGATPFEADVEVGAATFEFSAPRFKPNSIVVDVAGRQQRQKVSLDLEPDWALVTMATEPEGASIFVDGEDSGALTPGPVEILSGEHTIRVRKPGFRSWSDIIYVNAGETIALDKVSLEPIGAELSVSTDPSGASVIVDGEFNGLTPLVLELDADEQYDVDVLLTGYESVSEKISLRSGTVRTLDLKMAQVMGNLQVTTEPQEVEVYVDGNYLGLSDAVFPLHAIEHDVELKKEGYAGFSTTLKIQKNLTQEIRVKLLTHEEARLEALKQVRTTADGQQLVLLQPSPIKMGASRRQPGRRANEVYRTTNLNRLFYLGTREVTNAQFRAFAAGHSSGEFQGISLDKDEQPVVSVPWREVAFYCNWLSKQDDLEPFYIVFGNEVIGVNENALGYRLPSEAEWSYAARHVEGEEDLLHFPWGRDLPPPARHGNYADRAAQHVVGRIIFDYNDNHTVSAPVGSFGANSKELFDMGGNVAEWVHDYYSIPAAESTIPNLGPTEGEFHVIRGSSWLFGSIRELRLSFRDYGIDGRNDVGFRIARYAE